MALDIPNLDSKGFTELTREAIAKLPSLSSQWTDYNSSDPGITIIELLAWFMDINYYRLDRIREDHQRAFLTLVGISESNNIQAQVLLSFFSSHENTIVLPTNTKVLRGDLNFATQSELSVLPQDVEIQSIKVNDQMNGLIEVHQSSISIFGQSLLEDAYFQIGFSKAFSGKVSLYSMSSRGIEVANDYDYLQWKYQDLGGSWHDTEVNDNTNALMSEGAVLFNLVEETKLLRCVLKKPQEYESAPIVLKFLLNTVIAKQQKLHNETLAQSSGYVNQNYSLDEGIISESLELKVGTEVWEKAEVLYDKNPTSKLYRLEENRVFFGDGDKGKIPPRDELISVTYLSNAGRRGNVEASAQWNYSDEKVSINNVYSASAGEDKLSKKEQFISFQENLARSYSAVTAEDYERLALSTQGTNLARAKALAFKELNHVKLIVIPKSKESEPLPNAQTLLQVKEFLEVRRLLTTTLEVKAPSYVKASITLSVQTELFDKSLIENRIYEALTSYLHPLSGGETQEGWEFGKDLYLSKLYPLVAKIEGVSAVQSLSINTTSDKKLVVPDDALISSGIHNIEVITPDIISCEGS